MRINSGTQSKKVTKWMHYVLGFMTLVFMLAGGMTDTDASDEGFDIVLKQKIVAGDADAGDLFGFSVAATENWLIVGSKFADTDKGEDSGAVYVYRRNLFSGQWMPIQKIIPADAGDGDEFGEAVGIWGNRLAVGARFAFTEQGYRSGVAYIFEWNGRQGEWIQTAKVTPPDGMDDDEFGRSVAIGYSRIVVGARFADSDDSDTGAVYIYRHNRSTGLWQFEQKLWPEAGQSGSEFGRSVSYNPLTRGYLAVGARLSDPYGAVYLYRFDRSVKEWRLVQKLEAADGQNGDRFGQSVSLNRDWLAIGARDADTAAGEDTGAVYIYGRKPATGTWTFTQRLAPTVGAKKDQFGFSVTISKFYGTKIAVGSRRADTVGKDTGAVWLYELNPLDQQWYLSQSMVPADVAQADEFGQSVAIGSVWGEWVVVGSDQADVDGFQDAGAVYFYEVVNN